MRLASQRFGEGFLCNFRPVGQVLAIALPVWHLQTRCNSNYEMVLTVPRHYTVLSCA